MGTSNHCPACGAEFDSHRGRFCTNCGEPVDVDVDRETVRQNASGLLSKRDRRHLLADVQGDEEHRHEYTRVHVQEAVRQALLDFGLISKWPGLPNDEVFLATPEWDDPGVDDEDAVIAQAVSFFCLTSLQLARVGVDGLAVLVAWAIRKEVLDEQDDPPEIDVEIAIDGERLNAPAEDLLNFE